MAHLYQEPPIARANNLLAQGAVLEIVQRLPNGKIRSILELGDSTSRYDQLPGILRSFNTLRRHARSTSKPRAFTCIHPCIRGQQQLGSLTGSTPAIVHHLGSQPELCASACCCRIASPALTQSIIL